MSLPVLSLSKPSLRPPVRPALLPLTSAAATTRHISSQSLLDGAPELVILHQGSEYHLRLTRNDKLILTK
jgi:hemin uptake protein HemP